MEFVRFLNKPIKKIKNNPKFTFTFNGVLMDVIICWVFIIADNKIFRNVCLLIVMKMNENWFHKIDCFVMKL